MKNTNTAIILLDSPSAGYQFLFERKIATIPIFKRLVLTLDRAGMENIFIVSKNIEAEDCKEIESNIKGDFRFRRKICWYNNNKFFNENAMEKIFRASDGAPCIVSSGNIVISFRLIRSFIEKAESLLCEKGTVGLGPRQPFSGGVFLVASKGLDMVERFAKNQSIEVPSEFLDIQEKFNFWTALGNSLSAKRAEKQLIQNQKYHHSQLMDQAVNTIFSVPITRGLLHTSVTPNQITLLGVSLGFLSFCLLASGNYLGGLLGGLVAVATAVFDCCDGEIARLKFLDSDAGEYLDRVCDNIINVFVFSGIAVGMARQFGLFSALMPGLLMAGGGGVIFSLIYFEKGQEKGELFKGTDLFDTVQRLATRDFLYIVLAFGIIGKTYWFLWIAAIGSVVFAFILYKAKRKLLLEKRTQAVG